MNTQRSGFSLIEIMVVLVIIGVLMALVVPNVMGRPDEARITVAKADLRAIASALDMYKLDNFHYPSTQQGLEALVKKPTGSPDAKHWKQGGYLKKMPTDPWGNLYQYMTPGTHGGAFDLYSLGPNGVEGARQDESIIGEWQL
ncbi:MAG: type II secretion system major pseudopilin GspG [Rickettsiales bacterium]|nr:type II secretion system major pseudopilin GspG [Rickettsiales bacterium]